MNTPVVGIVGGVGAGKSSVVKRVVSLNLFIVDADRVGHQQLTVESVRNSLVAAFGKEILNPDGQIDRPKLAAVVFGNSPAQIKKRAQLDQIMHPVIRAEMLRQIETAPQEADAIILDAALLLEAGWADECDAIVFIDTPLEQRQRRVLENRNWDARELRRREESQWSIEKKREFADFIVNNSETPEVAAVEMEKILKQIIARKQQS